MFFDFLTDNPKYSLDANGIATIPISGPLFYKPSWFGMATSDISDALQAALGDAKARAIVLSFDSPGGECYGIHELAEHIYSTRAIKPIVSHVTQHCYSAAMYLALAASAVYVESATSALGSLGVYTTHADYSKMLEQKGIAITEISAGKDKLQHSPYKPLSDKAKAELQEDVDMFYSLMRSDVARFKGVSEDAAHSMFMDGKTFSGGQAVSIGLADAILTKAELTALITSSLEGGSMELKELASTIKAAFVDGGKELKASAMDEGKALGYAEGLAAGIEQGKAQASADAALKERTRIKGIMALAEKHKDYRSQITQLAFESESSEGDIALQILGWNTDKTSMAANEVINAPEVAPVPGTGANADPAAGQGSVQEQAAKLHEAAKALMAADPSLSLRDAMIKLTKTA